MTADPSSGAKEPLRQQRWYQMSKKYKNDNVLRSYQVVGLNWLIRKFFEGKNCILADEMGLGKTVQSVSYLEHLRDIHKIRGPFLVFLIYVCGVSCLMHVSRRSLPLFRRWDIGNVRFRRGRI